MLTYTRPSFGYTIKGVYYKGHFMKKNNFSIQKGSKIKVLKRALTSLWTIGITQYEDEN